MFGLRPKAKRWPALEDERRLVEAIRRAESGTSGEIRVHIDARCPGDALERARRHFVRLGMNATAARNGVLIYLAVADRKFAIVGDEAIHSHVGDPFWMLLRDRMEARFRAGNLSEGLELAISAVAERLAVWFPRRPDDQNELPDTLSSEGHEGQASR